MASTKKKNKNDIENTHLADLETTGIEIPAELNIPFSEGGTEGNPSAEQAPAKRKKRLAKASEAETPQEEQKQPEAPSENKRAKYNGGKKKLDNASTQVIDEIASSIISETVFQDIEKASETVEASDVREIEVRNNPEHQYVSGSAETTENTETANNGENANAENVNGEGDNFQYRGQQNGKFNKFNKFGKNGKFNKNRGFVQQEEPEDQTPLPEPDSEIWCKARDCWA
ncbi:MAG: hypothetical protein HUK20_15525, partial [Fibrobacter sp.]|nr:hypothetical protein [Fibrobacter sp.]